MHPTNEDYFEVKKAVDTHAAAGAALPQILVEEAEFVGLPLPAGVHVTSVVSIQMTTSLLDVIICIQTTTHYICVFSFRNTGVKDNIDVITV